MRVTFCQVYQAKRSPRSRGTKPNTRWAEPRQTTSEAPASLWAQVWRRRGTLRRAACSERNTWSWALRTRRGNRIWSVSLGTFGCRALDRPVVWSGGCLCTCVKHFEMISTKISGILFWIQKISFMKFLSLWYGILREYILGTVWLCSGRQVLEE